MYHIKEDLRSERSADQICQGLLDCLEQKNYTELTVADVTRAASVGRSTFYRNFDNLSDVVALLCDSGFRQILADAKNGTPIYEACFHYWFSNEHLLEAIMRSGNYPIFTESLQSCLQTALADIPLVIGREDLDYLSSVIAGGISGIMDAWLRRGKIETEEELRVRLAGVLRMIRTYNIVGELEA